MVWDSRKVLEAAEVEAVVEAAVEIVIDSVVESGSMTVVGLKAAEASWQANVDGVVPKEDLSRFQIDSVGRPCSGVSELDILKEI